MPHIHLACERVLDGAAFLTASDVPFFAPRTDARSATRARSTARRRVSPARARAVRQAERAGAALIAEQLGVAEQDVGVVGDDAIAEMQMARAGGAIGIAVASGSTSRAQWAAQPADASRMW
jgi:4-nitrophenyl phosphatase